ncbi:hypothetical protein [Halochromatium sp.]
MTEIDNRLESIPRQRWQDTCERFLHRHRGWLVSISETSARDTDTEALGQPQRSTSEPQPRELVSDVALHNLVFAEPDGAPELTLVVGDSGGSETSLSVQPQAIMLERQDHADAGIRFAQRDGNQVRVLFRVPAVPEALDGLTDHEL